MSEPTYIVSRAELDAEREENEALRRQVTTLTNTYVEFVERTRAQAEEANKVVDAERALADDLADALVQLASTMFMSYSVISRDEVDALLLRYREARA